MIRRDDGHGEPTRTKAPHVLELEGHLRQRFGTPVLIRPRGKERGQIVIDYQNQDEFERITAMIRG